MCSYLDIAKRVTLANTQGLSRADREFDRFERVAEPMPGGGWFDPTQEPVPVGISGEAWDAFVADCGRLGRGSKT